PPTFGEVCEGADMRSDFDISGIIGLSGDVVGSVALSMPWSTAERCVHAFTGADNPPAEDVCDAIGELANMIAGSAKSEIEGRSIAISCPSVVRGKELSVSKPKATPCVRIPCSSKLGEFELLLCLQEVAKARRAA
ncbi:MAG: chemotaxis protein CheX, partial [Phycisphaerales bacterium JB038]